MHLGALEAAAAAAAAAVGLAHCWMSLRMDPSPAPAAAAVGHQCLKLVHSPADRACLHLQAAASRFSMLLLLPDSPAAALKGNMDKQQAAK
jgi:hypothetical protein